MGPDTTGRERAFEDVVYLARSPNRIEILEALATADRTRQELRDLTDVSRATLARIVTELEERGWVARATGTEYTATPIGRHVVDQFVPFLGSMAALRQLGEAVAWLPVDELDIDLRHFADAHVVHPPNDDPATVVDQLGDLLQGTTEFRALTHFTPPDRIAAVITERVDADEMNAIIVTTAEILEYLRERPERRAQVRAWLDGGAQLYQLDGALPCNVWTMDETVIIKKSGGDARERSYGVPIVTQNQTVHAWATALIEKYQAAGTPLTADAFTTDSEGAGAATEET